LGVQSFVDQEAAWVGRLHKRTTVLEDIARLRASGVANINIDLIAGLPHQTVESWRTSLAETIATSGPHVSVYMLEVDEDSRLGRELIAGGTKYHAHFVPDDELTADLYVSACEQLEAAGISQYEISNFSREDFASRHNLRYWTRKPYLGFGVDAHSLLPAASDELEAVRFSTADSLDQYVAGAPLNRTEVSAGSALEESFFLGLRLTQGIDLCELIAEFGRRAVAGHESTIRDFVRDGLLERDGDRIRLTPQGRLLSNEVFEKFVADPNIPVHDGAKSGER
jgi:oxygen-independent coproporphyrinogen-3 oxidase